MTTYNKRYVWVTFQREGIHMYPLAATEPSLREVSFLGTPHRHIFHFRVQIEVFHDDREIEFILFKRWLESLFQDKIDANYKSCEMLSDDLATLIQHKYPGRELIVEVSEDGENGSSTVYPKLTGAN